MTQGDVLWSRQGFTANNMSRRPLVANQPQFPQHDREDGLEPGDLNDKVSCKRAS